MKTVTAKLSGMRKAQEFTVYPRPSNVGEAYNLITVQSDRAIGQFDATTGVGRLNWKGSNSKYMVHLSATMGAEEYTFPADFVEACKAAQPKPGDRIGNVGIIG